MIMHPISNSSSKITTNSSCQKLPSTSRRGYQNDKWSKDFPGISIVSNYRAIKNIHSQLHNQNLIHNRNTNAKPLIIQQDVDHFKVGKSFLPSHKLKKDFSLLLSSDVLNIRFSYIRGIGNLPCFFKTNITSDIASQKQKKLAYNHLIFPKKTEPQVNHLLFRQPAVINLHSENLAINKWTTPKSTSNTFKQSNLQKDVSLTPLVNGYTSKENESNKTKNCDVRFESILETKSNKKIKFRCLVCGISFDKRIKFSVHVRTHAKNNDIQCFVCSKKYASYRSLRMHAYLHNPILSKYRCKECGKDLNSSLSLANHRRTHLNKILECRFCRATFKHKINLTRHLKCHFNRKIVSVTCKICGLAYSSIGSLNTHVKLKH